jgi:S-formylglutathione hydrolase FrmB
MWVSKGALDQVMDSLIQAGMPEMIVVMPDGDDSWWSDRDPVTWEPPCTDNRLSDEPAGAYCAVRALYARYVVNEMVPLVDSLYRTRRDRGSRGIAGASMGGFGALTLAFDHPDLWSATLSHIGAISLLYVGARSASGYAGSAEEIAAYWRARGRNPLPPWATAFGPDVASWQRHDPVRIVKALQAANPRQVPAIYLDAATGDTTFAEQSRIVHTELTRAGIAHSYQEFPGRHDWAFIRAQLANGLRWMADRIAR